LSGQPFSRKPVLREGRASLPEFPPKILITIGTHNLSGKVLRRGGDQALLSVLQIQALGSSGCGDYWEAARHSSQHLGLNSRAVSDGRDKHPVLRQNGVEVLHIAKRDNTIAHRPFRQRIAGQVKLDLRQATSHTRPHFSEQPVQGLAIGSNHEVGQEKHIGPASEFHPGGRALCHHGQDFDFETGVCHSQTLAVSLRDGQDHVGVLVDLSFSLAIIVCPLEVGPDATQFRQAALA
jgi:hypothetical protein